MILVNSLRCLCPGARFIFENLYQKVYTWNKSRFSSWPQGQTKSNSPRLLWVGEAGWWLEQTPPIQKYLPRAQLVGQGCHLSKLLSPQSSETILHNNLQQKVWQTFGFFDVSSSYHIFYMALIRSVSVPGNYSLVGRKGTLCWGLAKTTIFCITSECCPILYF